MEDLDLLLAPRKIIHIDLDAFFCAVEELRDPKLKNKPFAVGGNPGQRGVVASCSYAARKFGIRSAMPMSRAVRLCPELIIVHHHFRDYTSLSSQVMDTLRTYSPLVQPISIDEAFIDMSHEDKDAVVFARQIQQHIRDHIHLPSSLGVASNKLVAKIATNVGKAGVVKDGYPYAIQVVPPGSEADFLAPLPSDALWGVGPKTAERLAELGVHTIGDIANYPMREIGRVFGQIGTDLHRRAQGIDNSPVHVSHETKSVSHEETFERDTSDGRKLRAIIHEQAESIGRQLRELELYGSTVKVKLRWPDFSLITRQQTMERATDDAKRIEEVALEILNKQWKPGKMVRLLGLGVSNLGPPSQQLNLWDWDPVQAEKQGRLQDAIETLHKRYGDGSLRQGAKIDKAKR